ncbi:LSM domain-containing protein [Colletotrichum orchidophilum]|uniref:LSM domain-containing protein n=1 Tax=Colletotrichum orchidophilum TaxID=1209926 RepID=A0A1G4B850_9PEZI|nr:LSM domain-containing protein [Colletotrichum orchidophilum]OHE97452.1 LSM domain-containing protein [Colletotrichum orchidophilum]
MDKEEGRDFLTSLLNKNLRVLATDGRMFLGQFKCTDPDRNVVLAHTYEYRQPSAQRRAEAAKKATEGNASVTMDMTSRYLGLVVVPGQYIVKIEVEEFTSQIGGRHPYADLEAR